MKIKATLPPNWKQIEASGLSPNPERMVFTYGDTIYTPGGRQVPDYIVAHEAVHMRQQKDFEGGKDAWWERYLRDESFRIQVEIEGYVRQYQFICNVLKDCNQRSNELMKIANSLSSPAYGGIIDTMAAYTMIKKKANI